MWADVGASLAATAIAIAMTYFVIRWRRGSLSGESLKRIVASTIFVLGTLCLALWFKPLFYGLVALVVFVFGGRELAGYATEHRHKDYFLGSFFGFWLSLPFVVARYAT